MAVDPSPERSVERLAASQYGVVDRQQAFEAGLTRNVIQGRLTNGAWDRVLPGVYRLAGAAETRDQRLMAAYLWAGSGAVVSHSAAARLLRLEGVECEVAELWIPSYRVSPADWLLLHAGPVPAIDTAFWGPLKITRPARTLIDLAGCLSEESLEVAMGDALRRGLVSDERLKGRLEDLAGRRGVGNLRGILRARDGAGGALDSRFEVKLRRLIRKSRLPQPIGQFWILHEGTRYRIDFAYPEQKLAIEADSFAHHSGRQAFESDRERLSGLAALGWRVLLVTWRQLTQDPDRVIARIARVLGHPKPDLRDP